MVTPPEEPSEKVIDQRARNRIIEYLELASSFAAQREYEEAAPPYVHVPFEVIEQWEDWVPHLDLVLTTSAAYSDDEVEALRSFQTTWETTVAALPDDYPSLEAVQAMSAWEAMRREAEAALRVFARRGRLPEDREAT